MLLDLLKSLARGSRRDTRRNAEELPVERLKRQRDAHSRAPTATHVEILFGNLMIGERRLTDLVDDCLAQSQVDNPPLKAFHRPLASYFLAQYFLHALELEGEQAECGVMSGTSALLMCRAARTRRPDYIGAGLHLIDSFEGLSDPTPEDRYFADARDGSGTVEKSMPGGWLSAPIERAQAALREFPAVQFHKGWIPKPFAELPLSGWSFVHLDLDLYAPTLASLEYFYPRLATGGVILCDDYGAPLFPGAHRAWDEFCERNDVPYVVLDTGQSAILK